MTRQFDEEEDIVPLPDNITDLDDICYDLWLKYFKPEKPLSAKDKAAIRDNYNKAAKKANKAAGLQRHIILTESTQWIPDPKKRQPKPSKVVTEKAIKQATEPKEEKPKMKKEPGGKSLIAQILELHQQGLSNKEIVDRGFNKSTVNRQVSEFKKRQANG